MMRCINALSSALFAAKVPKTPLTNGEQGTKEECQYVKNVPISTLFFSTRLLRDDAFEIPVTFETLVVNQRNALNVP